MTVNHLQFEKLSKKQFDLFLRDMPDARLLLFHILKRRMHLLLASHPCAPIEEKELEVNAFAPSFELSLQTLAGLALDYPIIPTGFFHSLFEAEGNQGTFALCLCSNKNAIKKSVAADTLDSLTEVLQPILQTYPLTTPDSPIDLSDIRGKGLWDNAPLVNYTALASQPWQLHEVSPYIFKLTGIHHAEFTEGRYDLSEFVHPDDQETVLNTVTHAIAHLKGYELCFRLVNLGGHVSYVIAQGITSGQDGRFVNGLLIDISSRRAAEQKLFEAQKQLNTVFDSIRQAVIVADKNGNVSFINSMAASLTGWEKHEAAGQALGKIFQMIDSHTRAPLPNPFDEVYRTLSHYHPSANAKLVSRYGIELKMDYAASPLFDDGLFTGMVLNFWDLTETYYEREVMRKMRMAIENSQDGFYIINHKGQFLYANNRIRARLGADNSSLHGKTIFDLIPETHHTTFKDEWKQLEKAQYMEFERNVVHQGQTVWMLIKNYHIVYDDEPFVVGIVRDISSLKQIQRELEEGKQTLSFLIEHINIVLYRYNLVNQQIFYAGMQSQNVLGIATEHWSDFDGWVTCLHPDNRDWAVAQIKKFIEAGLNASFEYRIVDDQKRVKWIRDVLTVIKNDEGKPIEVVGFMVDISEEKQREKELRESKQLFETILDSVQTAIYLINNDKKLISVNKYCRQVLGYGHHQLDGLEAREFLPYEATVHVYDAFDRVLTTKESQSMEHSLEVNGATLSAYSIFVPIFDANGEVAMVCGSSIDISKTKRAQRELEKVRERLNFALTAGHIGIWDYMVIDGKIITNSVFDSWTKQPSTLSDSEFSWLLRFVHPLDIGALYKSYYSAKKSIEPSFECELRLKTGDDQYIWTLLQAKILERNENNEPTRIIGVHIDISRQKKLLLELSKAKETAEEANKAKSLFLANLSHEIRTPMNAILGFAQIMEKQLTDPALSNYVESIKSSGKTLLNLINDILDLSKIEANKVTVKSEPVDLRHVTQELSQLFNYRYEQKNLNFHVTIYDNVPLHVYLDELKLKQILINLISNAIKFTEKGSVTLAINFDKQLEQNGTLTIYVKDTGIGIASNSQQTIFEPFMQHENHDAKKYGGTGLGLSITKKLMELMNGTITVESQTGQGTTMTLEFKKVDFDREYSSASKEEPESNILENTTLLLVAQRPGGLEIVSKHLIFQQLEVYETVGFDNAQTQTLETPPDLVVVELWNGNTPEHFSVFMEQMNSTKTPVLAYSHEHTPIPPTLIEGYYFHDWFCAPIMHDHLIKLLQKHIKPKPHEPILAEPLEFNVQLAAKIVLHTTDVLPVLDQLRHTQSSQLVKELAEKMILHGSQLGYQPFTEFGNRLHESLKLFDVVNIDNTIKLIDKHYRQLKNLANHEQ